MTDQSVIFKSKYGTSRPCDQPKVSPRAALAQFTIFGCELSAGVAGPGADDAFLAAELVAVAHGAVLGGRDAWSDRIAVRAARVRHIDGERGTGTLHRDGR